MQNKDYPRLLDCPFCGGEAEIIKPHGQKIDTRTMPYRVALAVVCKNMECGANMGNWYERAEAVAAWNRRAQPANEPLTCDGCVNFGTNQFGFVGPDMCIGCARKPRKDLYRRPPEGSENE